MDWQIADLEMIERIADQKLASLLFISPKLQFRVQRSSQRIFIACATPMQEWEKPALYLTINHRPAKFTEAEWADLLDHEINHAILRQTDRIRQGVYTASGFNWRPFFANFFRLTKRLVPKRKRNKFLRLAELFRNACQDKSIIYTRDPLGQNIDEILAEALINPISDSTRTRYSKLVNNMIRTNETLGADWVGRAEALSKILGAPINILEAEAKILGSNKIRITMRALTPMVFKAGRRLGKKLKYDKTKRLYTLR